MNTESVATTQPGVELIATSASKTSTALMAGLLGLALLFVAGFAETNVLHNATHDTRHSAAFPCH